MEFLQKIMLVWTKVSMTQRVLLIAITLTAVAGVGLIVYWARRPDMRFLFGDLSAQEAVIRRSRPRRIFCFPRR